MARPIALAAGLALVLGAGAAPAPAAAQSDPAAEALIERLRPGGQTRGIRLPGAQAPAQPTAPAATAPTLTPATPATPLVGTQVPGTQPVAPPPPATTTARPVTPPPPRDTTAPADVPAVSLTVTFATGSARLTPQAEQTLNALGRALSSAELAPFRFRIEGHTDTTGSRALNQALSEERAAAVRDFLIQRHGIAPQRLVAVGFGQDQLLVQTPDNTPEARNRRVQVVNLGS
jgi:outer membrane protein OmpA-like peptidoglycan-associated protein